MAQVDRLRGKPVNTDSVLSVGMRRAPWWPAGVVLVGVLAAIASMGAAEPAAAAAAAAASSTVLRSVSVKDLGIWDPAQSPAPTTRWFVLPGDQQGAGSYQFLSPSGPAADQGLQLTAPGIGDRIAVATVPPAGFQIGALFRFAPAVTSLTGSSEPVAFADVDCNGTSPGGIVRVRTTQPPTEEVAPELNVALDIDVYADGSVGSGPGTPVLFAGQTYGWGAVGQYCPVVRDLGLEVSDGSSALLPYSFMSGPGNALQYDFFRAQPPGASVPLRLGGPDRIDTALQIARVVATGSANVVLGRSDGFADDLAGAVLAKFLHAPLLITPTAALDPRVAEYLRHDVPAGSHVYLLGGTGALSDQVARQVATLGLVTSRLAGSDRYATAVAIATFMRSPTCGIDEQTIPCAAVLADGTNFPDALSGSALDQPILYTRGSVLPAVSLGYLNSSASVGTVYAVGGPAATAATNSPYRSHLTSFVGADRYATSALVAASLVLPGTRTFAVATGQNFPDALVGAALAPVLLTTPQSLPTTVAAVLQHRAPAVGTVYLLGTSDVVSDTVGTQVQAALRAGDITTWP